MYRCLVLCVVCCCCCVLLCVRMGMLENWLRKSGARFPKVEICRYAEEGRDLRSKAPIRADEEVHTDTDTYGYIRIHTDTYIHTRTNPAHLSEFSDPIAPCAMIHDTS